MNKKFTESAIWIYFRWHIVQVDSIYRKIAVQTNGDLFCFLFNFMARLRKKDVRFYFDKQERIYSAESKKYKRYFFSKFQNYNSYLGGIEKRGISLGEAYFLPNIKFNDNDTVIDCGANVGDLKIYFDENKSSFDHVNNKIITGSVLTSCSLLVTFFLYPSYLSQIVSSLFVN